MFTTLQIFRAGHCFRAYAKTDSRLSLLCREAFGFKNCPGYLKNGLPTEYGEGATEAVRDREAILSGNDVLSEDLSIGDLERICVEWKSILSVIIYSPKMDSERWEALIFKND